MTLSVELITSVDQLSREDIATWNDLARNPLQRWEWLGSWWHAYQDENTLNILSVKRQGEIIAFAPWCVERRVSTGRTIQFLGSGKACTDHLSLLVRRDATEEVCHAVANWLTEQIEPGKIDQPRASVWDSIELIGVDQTDAPINCLVESMEHVGLTVQRTEGMGCYAIELPETWDEYVRMRSKSGRREIRQSFKHIENGTLLIKRISDHQSLESFWDQFVSLHQRRRHASGTTGCFDHPPFDTFLRKAASELLTAGLLEFVVASVDGVPVAAQFAIADDNGWYFYQSGMEPDATDLRPGRSVLCYAIRETIRSGRKQFDMMRGDEPYKLRWRAELLPAQEVRVCSPRFAAQMRHQVYKAGVTFRNLVKSSFGIGQQQH